MHVVMLGRIPDDADTKFRKRHVDARDIATIKKHLADQRQQPIGEYQQPITAADIHSNVPHCKEVEIRQMIRKYEHIVAEINTT